MDSDGHNLGYGSVGSHDFWGGMIDYYSEPMDESDDLVHHTLANDEVKVTPSTQFTNLEEYEDATTFPQDVVGPDRDAMLEIINREFDKEIAIREEELRLIEENLNQTNILWDRLQSIWSKKVYTSLESDQEEEQPLKQIKKKKKPKLLPQKPLYYRLTDGSFVRILCPSCKRDKFANQLGFVNHCRIVHKLKFATYEHAARHCGVAVNESEVPPDDPSRHDISLGHIVGYKKSSGSKDILVPQDGLEASRFYVRKKVIVGNTSKMVHSVNGKPIYKWLVYVRGPEEDSDISMFIRKVRFFLPSEFKPRDIIEIPSPPYHLTREGSGELLIRVQLHFIDPKNKPENVIHQVTLNHNSVFQSKGEEVEIEVELDKYFYDRYVKIMKSESKNLNQSFEGENSGDEDEERNESFLEHYKVVRNKSAGEVSEDDIHRFIRIEAEKTYPLISEEFYGKLPYSVARTQKEWYSWSDGKQKSSEWQRASRLNMMLREELSHDMTTKDVLLLCKELHMTPEHISTRYTDKDPFENPYSYESMYLVPRIMYQMEALSKMPKKNLLSKIYYCKYCGSPHMPIDRFDELQCRCGDKVLAMLGEQGTYTTRKEYIEKSMRPIEIKKDPLTLKEPSTYIKGDPMVMESKTSPRHSQGTPVQTQHIVKGSSTSTHPLLKPHYANTSPMNTMPSYSVPNQPTNIGPMNSGSVNTVLPTGTPPLSNPIPPSNSSMLPLLPSPGPMLKPSMAHPKAPITSEPSPGPKKRGRKRKVDTQTKDVTPNPSNPSIMKRPEIRPALPMGPLILPKGIQPLLNSSQPLNQYQQQILSYIYYQQQKNLQEGKPADLSMNPQLLQLLVAASNPEFIKQQQQQQQQMMFQPMIPTQAPTSYPTTVPRKKRGRLSKAEKEQRLLEQQKASQPSTLLHPVKTNQAQPLPDEKDKKLQEWMVKVMSQMGIELDEISDVLLCKLMILFGRRLVSSTWDTYKLERREDRMNEAPMKIVMPVHVYKTIQEDFKTFGILTNEGMKDES